MLQISYLVKYPIRPAEAKIRVEVQYGRQLAIFNLLIVTIVSLETEKKNLYKTVVGILGRSRMRWVLALLFGIDNKLINKRLLNDKKEILYISLF